MKNSELDEKKSKVLSNDIIASNYDLIKTVNYDSIKSGKRIVTSYLFNSFTKLYKKQLASKMEKIIKFYVNGSVLKNKLVVNKIAKLHFINNGRYSLALEVNGEYYLLNPANGEFVTTEIVVFNRYISTYLDKVGELEHITNRTKYGQTNYLSVSSNSLLDALNSLDGPLYFHLGQIDPHYEVKETGAEAIQVEKLKENCPYNLTLILEGEDINTGNKVYFDANNTYPPYP